MTLDEVMKELEGYGNEGTKSVLIKHGAREPFFGVKVQDLKKIVKKVKKDYELSKELYATGNSDAMYLAGLIADENQMTKKDLRDWQKGAYWSYMSEFTVPWVASETPYGMELALEWIESSDELTATTGWATLSSIASVTPDEEMDKGKYAELLDRVGEEIHASPNRVRHCMNAFVIATGSYIPELTQHAYRIADKVGKVSVNMGDTACKVPDAATYIKKVEDRGKIGAKRKGARC